MKIKATRDQFEAIELALRVMLSEHRPTNPAEKLVYDIVYKMYSKVRTRVERIASTKEGWNLKLSEQESQALHVFIANYPMPEGYHYETIQVESLYGKIDQEYGSPIYTKSEYRMLAT